jgi:hypothetical protein
MALVVSVLSVVGCSKDKAPDPHLSIHQAPVLESRLSPEEREEFYHLTFGTGVFSYYAFMALEDPKTNDFFAHNLERFGFLADFDVPEGLPVGLAIEKTDELPITVVGVNCAACHVNEYRYNDKSFRVEGAPNLVDTVAFKKDLINAVKHTLDHPKSAFHLLRTMGQQHEGPHKLLQHIPDFKTLGVLGVFGDNLADEFTRIVVQERDRAKSTTNGKTDIHALLAAHETPEKIGSEHSIQDRAIKLSALAVPEDNPLAKASQDNRKEWIETALHRWAYSARLLMAWVETMKKSMGPEEELTMPGPGRADAWGAARQLMFDPQPETAPSSIPGIFDFGNLARYQWNGTTNTNVQRGLAAAIGASAFFDEKSGFSVIRIDNMMKLEGYAKKFVIPNWPENYFPAVDSNLSERGAALYREHCASCHDAGKAGANGLVEFPTYDITELGTDSTYVTDFKRPVGDKPFATAMAEVLARMESEYYRANNIDEAIRLEWEPESRKPAVWESPTAYPARPLEGVWLTPPYLHNGSVPSLYDLLLPASERPDVFLMGTREYDPKKVGFLYDSLSNPDGFEFDTSITGNSNSGHEYGTSLSEDDRWALVEFLKTK